MHRSSESTHHTHCKFLTPPNLPSFHACITHARPTSPPPYRIPVPLQSLSRLSRIASDVTPTPQYASTMPSRQPPTPASPAANSKVRTTKSYHAHARPKTDPRKTRTVRSNTTPKERILALQLCTTPVVSILLLPRNTPTNALITAHTAVNAHAHWRVVATGVSLPTCFTVTCHASELDTRLLRVCVFGGRRGGDFVIPIRSVLGGSACVDVGKRGCLDVQGVVGTFSGWGIGVGFRAAMSVFKEMKGCSVRAKRVGGGRTDVCLGQWDFGKEGFCRVNICGDVLWFGIGECDGNVVRVVLQMVRRRRFGGVQVVGETQIGLAEIGKIEEGQILKVGWWRGGMRVVVLGVVEMVRKSLGQVGLEIRLTR